MRGLTRKHARMDQSDDDIPGLIGDLLRLGTIQSVDLAAAMAVVKTGDVVSPPLPWIEWAGAFRSWSPPSINEQVLVLCPEADIAGAVIVRGLYSTSFPPLSSAAEPQIDGPSGLRIKLMGNGIEITAPGVIAITGDVTINGDVDVTGTVTATTDVIGGGISLKNHTHGGVQSGGSNTGAPS